MVLVGAGVVPVVQLLPRDVFVNLATQCGRLLSGTVRGHVFALVSLLCNCCRGICVSGNSQPSNTLVMVVSGDSQPLNKLVIVGRPRRGPLWFVVPASMSLLGLPVATTELSICGMVQCLSSCGDWYLRHFVLLPFSVLLPEYSVVALSFHVVMPSGFCFVLAFYFVSSSNPGDTGLRVRRGDFRPPSCLPLWSGATGASSCCVQRSPWGAFHVLVCGACAILM